MKTYTVKLTLVAAASILALTGCRDEERQARIAVPDPTPPMHLADALALPYAPAAPVDWRAPDEGYLWAERAYAQQAAFYEAPPTYGFYDNGLEPLVWETADNWSMYAEPWDDGYRYYYYEPDAAYPYFIRDDDYGYAFDDRGVLVSAITAAGAYLAADRLYALAPDAGRYYARGRDLRNASMQAQRIRIDEQAWRERAPKVSKSARPWIEAGSRDDEWRSWRQRRGDDQARRFAGVEVRQDGKARRPARESRREQREFARAEQRDQRAALGIPRSDDRGGGRAERGQARAAEAQGHPAAFVARPDKGQRGGGPPESRGDRKDDAPRSGGDSGGAKAHGGGHGQGGGHGGGQGGGNGKGGKKD